MFTVAQIEAARNKSKTGADFPRYVQEIKALGLIRYEFMVEDGRTLFYGGDRRTSLGGKYHSDEVYVLRHERKENDR